MALQKYFYKDAVLGVFIVDEEIVPAGTCTITFDKSDTIVTITSVSTEKVILEATEITNLLKENDSAYTGKPDLLGDVKDFF